MQASKSIVTAALAATLLAALPATAQPGPWASPRGQFVWSGALGGFTGEDNPGKLANQKSDYAGYGGFAWRPHPNFALEAEIPFHGQRYDTPASIGAPPAGRVDGRVNVDTIGISVGPKLIVPLGRVDLFAGAGVGWYSSRFTATGTSFGLPAEYSDTDRDMGTNVKAGLDFYITRSISIGLEYRRLWLDADFGTASNGKIAIGGHQYLLGVRGRF